MSQILPLIKRIAQDAREKSGDGRVEKFFIFKFGPRSFAVPAVDVAEVSMPLSVIDIPQKSDLIAGVVNIRGNIIPIVNLRRRIGMEPLFNVDDDSRLLLFSLKTGTHVGMYADDIECRLRDGIVESFPENYSGDYEKTFRTVIVGHEKFPLFMIDIWLEKSEIEIILNVIESF